MKPLRKALSLIPALLALTSFVLPAGLGVCIGPEGHVAIEPIGQDGRSCCEEPATRAGTESCVPDSESDCEDIALSSGAARLSRPEAGAPLVTQCCVTLPGMTLRDADALIASRSAVRTLHDRTTAPPITILRC